MQHEKETGRNMKSNTELEGDHRFTLPRSARAARSDPNKSLPLGSIAWFLIGIVSYLLANSTNVSAATLKVNVFRSGSNTTVSEAQVCLANSSGSLLERKTTDSEGRVTFDNLGQATFKLTISKSGFVGVERQIPMSGSNRQE